MLTIFAMLAVLALLLGLGLLMTVAYRGFSVIFFAPIFALLAAGLSGLHPLPTYTEIFLPSLASYLKTYFPFFLLGAVFGKVMESTGAAESIANTIVHAIGRTRAVLAVVLSCAVLTYGGVSLFVVAFAVYPIAVSLFKAAGIPKRLMPATIALGAFTFTMDALPGTPQIQNTIPMKFFNTDLYAAPGFGIAGSVIVLSLGLLYLHRRVQSAKKAGEGYSAAEESEPAQKETSTNRSGLQAFLPLILVLAGTLILQKWIFAHWDISSWATLPPYKMDPTSLKGSMNNWALMVALSMGILAALAFTGRGAKSFDLAKVIQAGTMGSLLAVMNTASEVGFGSVIKSLPGFRSISSALGSLGQSHPLLSEAMTINLLAGITGSASGGLSIALDAFGKDYLALAQKIGLSPELLHRVASMSSGGMDTLPHNGAVITLLMITGLTHRQSYKDIFAITLIKTFAVFLLIGLHGLVS